MKMGMSVLVLVAVTVSSASFFDLRVSRAEDFWQDMNRGDVEECADRDKQSNSDVVVE